MVDYIINILGMEMFFPTGVYAHETTRQIRLMTFKEWLAAWRFYLLILLHVSFFR